MYISNFIVKIYISNFIVHTHREEKKASREKVVIEDDEEEETAPEKRLRLAKQYIAQVEEEGTRICTVLDLCGWMLLW